MESLRLRTLFSPQLVRVKHHIRGRVGRLSLYTSSSCKRKLPSVPTKGNDASKRRSSPSSNNLLTLLSTSRRTESPPPTAVVESLPPTSVVVPDAVQSPPPVVAVKSPPPTAVVKSPLSPAVLPTGATETVTVSDSPVKPDQNVWLEKLDLLIMDKDILQSNKWPNDNIVRAAQLLLSKQSKGKITGWQHTQCAKTGFRALPRKSTFIQILHVSSCHWILVSNVNPKDGSGFFNSVGIYDSNRMMYVEKALKNEICSFVKPTCDVYMFDIMNIQTQTNTSDCGLFSIACATELVEGHDPVVCHWDQAKMRPHLMKCLVEGKMLRFPCSKQRRIGLGQRVRNSEKEQLYCMCRLPNDKVRAMIEAGIGFTMIVLA